MDKLENEQAEMNLAIQQLNLSVMHLAEQTKRPDLFDERLMK
jgi:hypothetical protein